MTIWMMIAAVGMLMWAICLAIAMGPIWARSGRKQALWSDSGFADRRVKRRQTHRSTHSWIA